MDLLVINISLKEYGCSWVQCSIYSLNNEENSLTFCNEHIFPLSHKIVMDISVSGTLEGQQARCDRLPSINSSFICKEGELELLGEHGTTKPGLGCSFSKRYMLKKRREWHCEIVYEDLIYHSVSWEIVYAPYFIAFLLNNRAAPLLRNPNVIGCLSLLNISHISKNGSKTSSLRKK